VLRPTIYVPPGFDRDAAEHVFLHELAHIRRGDLIVNAVSIVVLGAYWFNPFVWYAVRQTGNIRELCTDASVARLLGERTIGYRTTLLSVARNFLDARPRATSPLGFLGLVEESTMIVERLRQLENAPWRNPRLRNAAALVAVVVIGLTVLPMCESNRSLESIDAPEISAQKPQSTIGSAALNLWQTDDPPKIVNPVAPTYPAEARETGIEGEVFVEMVIDETGKVSNVRVLRGPQIFHDSAIDAAEQMTFEPGRKDGAPVAVKITQRMTYRLSDK
jgi:TonB family protein